MYLLRTALIVVAIRASAAVVSACGDTGWLLAARNDTDVARLVRLTYDDLSSGRVYQIEPGGVAVLAASSGGPAQIKVDLLDETCQVISSVSAQNPREVLVVVRPDGSLGIESYPRNSASSSADEVVDRCTD